MRAVVFALGWGLMALAVWVTAVSASHDRACIFSPRKMTRARAVQMVGLFMLALGLMALSFQM